MQHKNDMVRARIARDIKEESERILDQLGISMSDAIRMFLSQVCLRKAFPVELTIPNAEHDNDTTSSSDHAE